MQNQLPPNYPPQPKKGPNINLIAGIIASLFVLFVSCGMCGMLLKNRPPADVAEGTPGAPPPAMTSSASADWRTMDGACVLTADIELSPRLHDEGDGHPFCSATLKDLSRPNAAGLTNLVGYIARGVGSATEEIEVYVNINVPADSAKALDKFAQTCAFVFKAVEKSEMPANLKRAARDGQKANFSLKEGRYRFEKDVWPSGKGYTHKLFVTPR